MPVSQEILRVVGMLTRYKNPPNKDIGEGLNTAFQKMKEWKLRAPKLRWTGAMSA